MITYIIDIDGVILEHEGLGACRQWRDGAPPRLLPGVTAFFDRVEREGAYIVLTTSRKEACRRDTESQLRSYDLFWDLLVMGLPHGERVLINDAKPGGAPSARVIVLGRNEGMSQC